MRDLAPLSEALKTEIDLYLRASENRSVASLARKAGLGYSTVRRLAQGEARPELSTVITVLGTIKGRDEFITFLNKHFPQEGRFLDRHYGEDAKLSDSELDHFLRDDIANTLLHLACTTTGTSVETIQRLAGEMGLKKLDELVEAGFVIREADGRVRFFKESFAITNFETFKKNNEIHARNFDASLIGTDAALLAHQTESVSMNGLRKIKEAGLEYLGKLSEIKREHPGRVPFFVTLMMNVYDRRDVDQE